MFPTLRGYRASWLASDAIAGMMLAAIAAPAQLATAKLAGMPAISGLAALVAGSIGIAAFGSNRFMAVGGGFDDRADHRRLARHLRGRLYDALR